MGTTVDRKDAWATNVQHASEIPLVKATASENALKVLEKRYLGKDTKGKVVEDVHAMWMRVASNLAQADRNYGASDERVAITTRLFFNLMAGHKFLPNSPTIMNAGRELQQLSACFVLPVPDDIPGIFEAIKQQAIIHKTGGGTGFSFSRLRPKNDIVGSTGGVASGPISFMRIFNTATEQIKQGGTRRGANMAILQVDHPDILDFIDMKLDPGEMTNFNVSVAITDAFMEAWKAGEKYPLVNPKTKEVVKHLDAREVMDRIARNAHASGEPGIFFIDRANQTNPVPHVAAIESTNPCGEVDLMPYDSCNLGSIVLDNHLTLVNGAYEVDWDALRTTVHQSVHCLDNVIDMNNFPLPQIREMSEGTRRIGLGIMGFARVLFKLGIPYDSDEGVAFARRVWRFVEQEGVKASEKLAETRGPYGFWNGSVHQQQGLPPRRNAYVTTIAPTGTISMLAETSGGCEPEFSLIWYKNVMDGTHLPYVLDYFGEVAKREGFWYDGLMDDVLKNNGSARGLARVPEKWQRVFATAMDVSPEWHVLMQAAFQEATHSAVSKTINLPKNATEKDVKDAYLLAYEAGCKGITVYRDGSRKDQVLNLGKSEKLEGKARAEHANGNGNGNGHGHHAAEALVRLVEDRSAASPELAARALAETHPGLASILNAGLAVEDVARLQDELVAAQRREADLRAQLAQAKAVAAPALPRGLRVRAPDEVEGVRERIPTGYGDIYVTTNFADDSDKPVEVLADLGRAGGFVGGLVEAICRTGSVMLQAGGNVDDMLRQWAGIRSPRIAVMPQQGKRPLEVLSVPDAMAHAVRRAILRRQAQLARMRGGRASPAVPAPLAGEPTLVPDTGADAMEVGAVVPASEVNEAAEEAEAGRRLVEKGDAPDCPECGAELRMQEGCVKCGAGCGYSVC